MVVIDGDSMAWGWEHLWWLVGAQIKTTDAETDILCHVSDSGIGSASHIKTHTSPHRSIQAGREGYLPPHCQPADAQSLYLLLSRHLFVFSSIIHDIGHCSV